MPLDRLVGLLGLAQELLERAARHVLGDEDDALLGLLLVNPVVVELDDVRMVQADQVLEYFVDFLLISK